jgi:hypothetical protein
MCGDGIDPCLVRRIRARFGRLGDSLWAIGYDRRMPTEGPEWEQKVLDAFLDGERLIRIPAKRKKRDVILRWLLREFEPGVEVPEAEVNRILRRHHPDCATLRRELFESGYLHRRGGGGTYWRPRA